MKKVALTLMAMMFMLVLIEGLGLARDSRVVKIAGNMTSYGAGPTLFLKSDGSVWSTGFWFGHRRYFGDLKRPALVERGAVDIMACAVFGLIRKRDGEVRLIGDAINPAGKPYLKSTPAPASIPENIVDVQNYALGRVVLTSGGDLWQWGQYLNVAKHNDLLYPIGDQRVFPPVKLAGTNGTKAMVAFENRLVFLKTDGTVWLWGGKFQCYAPSTAGQPEPGWLPAPQELAGLNTDDRPFQIMSEVKAISSNMGDGEAVVALKENGELWLLGILSADGTRPLSNDDSYRCYRSFTKIMTDVAACSGRMALKKDGSLWAWGESATGAIGVGDDGRYPPVLTEPPRILDDVELISYGPRASFAVKKDGSLWGWGRDVGAVDGHYVPQKLHWW